MHLNNSQMKVTGKWQLPTEGIILSGISLKEIGL